MNEPLKEALTRVAGGLGPVEPDLEAIGRRGRRRRNRRYGLTGLVAIVVAAALALPLYGLSGIGSGPAVPYQGEGIAGIVFSTLTFGPIAPGEIYRIDPDGTGLTKITTDGADYSSVTASPDGTKLAFDRFTDASSTSDEGIYVANADGSDMHEVLPSDQPRGISITQIRWSPDGRTIGFIRRDMSPSSMADGQPRLWFMNPDGSDAHVVSDRQIVSFAWSPDSSQVVFEQQDLTPDGKRFLDDLYVADVRGGTLGVSRRLTNDSESLEPVWAPSRSSIAYTNGWARSSTATVLNLRTLTSHPVVGLPGLSGALAWSPNGQKLLASSDDSGTCRLLAIGPDGAARTVFEGPKPGGPLGSPGASSVENGCVQSAQWVAPSRANAASDLQATSSDRTGDVVTTRAIGTTPRSTVRSTG